MAEALKKVEKPLTPKERKFLRYHLRDNLSLTDSYLAVTASKKEVTRESAGELGHRMFQRIKQKVDWGQLLELSGLDDARLISEIDARLNAMTTKYSGTDYLGEFEDNATRMRATELLAELRGKRKSQIDVSGEVTVKGYIGVSPDDWDDADSL